MKIKNYFFLGIVTLMAITACKKNHINRPAGPGGTNISFTPASAAKDSIVVIHGSGFGTTPGNVGVTFNGVAATVLAVSDDTLKVKVPIHAGSGKITVKVGSKSFTSPTDFTYLYTVSTLAGNGTAGYADATKGSDAKFSSPSGVAVDAAGNIYVADYSNSRIRKITPAGEVSTLAGNGTAGYTPDPTAGSAAEFANPTGVAVDATTGNIYVADRNNNRIRKVDPTGNVVVSTFAGDGTAAQFNKPRGIAADAAGNIYVADTYNNRILKITPAGGVSTLAGDGTPDFKDDQTGTAAEFNNPWGVAADAAGNIYVADNSNFRIRKITPAGVVTTLAGDGTTAEFYGPQGIAVDATGNIYVVDSNRILKITPAGVVSTLAGDGTGTFKDGIGTAAEFYNPIGIAVDAAGNIYVADTANSRIRMLQ